MVDQRYKKYTGDVYIAQKPSADLYLRDTESILSFLSRDALPTGWSPQMTGTTVTVTGIHQSRGTYQLCKVPIVCDLYEGDLTVALTNRPPLPGVALVLGNDVDDETYEEDMSCGIATRRRVYDPPDPLKDGTLSGIFDEKCREDPSREDREDPSREGREDPSRKGREDPSREGREDPSREGREDPSREGREDPSREGREDPSREGREDPSREGREDPSKEGREDPMIQSTPGLVKVHKGDDVDLIWTTTEEITSAVTHHFYHTSSVVENRLMIVQNGFTFPLNECLDRGCQHLNGTHTSGIRIPGISTSDAKSKYIINLVGGGINWQNGDAVIYVYEKPNKAQLTSNDDEPEEGDDVRLTCVSTSNSMPEGNRGDVTMTYKWTRNNDQDIDPNDPPDRHSFPEEADRRVLKISPVDREDSNVNYKCIGQEEGSRLESDASDPYALDVRYAPGAASIQGDSNVVAGDDVTLTCSADRGNPEGTYKWKKPNGGTQDGKNLNIENLNVDDDEGDYECYVENDVAQGTSATHTLTVNSVPGVERDLDSEKSVVNTDDSFSVSCAFRAKPAVSVVWKREDDSALPSHIFSFSPSQQADGKFT
ncbi:hypothetical protein CAPTEDRAFT_206732, partial [Capitella teleta]